MKSLIRVQAWIENEKAKKLYEQLKSKKNGIEVALLYLAENGDKNLLNSIFKDIKETTKIVEKKVIQEPVEIVSPTKKTKVTQKEDVTRIKNDIQEEKIEMKSNVSNTNIMSNKKDGKPIFNLKAKK